MKILKKLKEKELERLCQIIDQDTPSYILDRKILREFLDLGEVFQYDRGEILNPPGEVDTNVYILVSGITRQWYWDGDKEVTNGFGLPPTISISYHGYYGGQPSQMFYEACCRCRILRFSKKDFDEMNRRSHEFALWNLSLSQNQLYYYEMKYRVISGSALEKYEAIEKNRPEILQKVSLKVIASYLGISPQYLSKLRNQKLKNHDNLEEL